MPKYYYFNTRRVDELNLAQRIFEGKKVELPNGRQPRILDPAEYFEQPGSNHPHPVGYPCFKSCYMFWESIEEFDNIPDWSEEFE